MPCYSADSQNHPCMLNRVVVIIELRSYRSDLQPNRMLHHLRQPMIRDHLHIIVDKSDQFTSGMLHTEIVDRRIIEHFVILNDTNVLILPGQMVKIVQCFRVCRLIINNDDLIIFIDSFFKNTLDTQPQDIITVTCGYDQADQRFTRQSMGHFVGIGQHSHLNCSRLASVEEIIF